MVLDFRSDMFQHAQRLSLAFHDTESKGILMYRINNQAAAMGQIVTALPAVAQSLLTIIGHGLHHVPHRPRCWRCSRSAVDPVHRLLDHLLHRPHRAAPVPRAGLGAINLAIVYEAMAMMRVVLAFGRERREYRRFRKQGEKAVDARSASRCARPPSSSPCR